MFFVSEHLQYSASDIDIRTGYRTDHNMITISLKTKQTKRGCGIWKLNVSHLLDDSYIQAIKTCIHDTVKQYAVPLYRNDYYSDYNNYESVQLTINECLFYETLIMMIRGESVKYSKRKARNLRALEKQAEIEIKEAENKFATSGNQDDAISLDIAKNKLEEIRKPMIEGLIIRSRVAWHQHGERNSAYFLSLEKRNHERKSIQYIQEGSQKITSTDGIIAKFTHNLQVKYSSVSRGASNPTFITDNIKQSLDPVEKINIDKTLTLRDLTVALQSMKKGKTPGSNGFPVAFFRTFWSDIGPFFAQGVHSVTDTQRKSAIT